MALDKIALFEVHLDGAQFGPKSIGGKSESAEMPTGSETEAEPTTDEQESSGSGRKRAIVGTVLALAIFGVVAWRRRKGEQTTMDDYTESEGGLADSGSVEVDDVSA